MTRAPQLSIVVVVVEGPDRLQSCLEALAAQVNPPEMEILVPWLVPWDDTHGDSSGLRLRFPGVQFIPVEGRRTYAELRALGVARARGAIVAITEDHCAPSPEWCAQIIKAHAEPHAAIGGAVEKDVPDTALNWAFYLADYLRYLDPVDGPAHHLTDCNVTYKRAALEDVRQVWAREFHENAVHEALIRRGESLWLASRIVVRQRRNLSLGSALWDRYAFGRLFGSTRVHGATAGGRARLLAVSLLLPPLLVARIAGHILRTRRYAAAFLRSLPAIVLISTAWSWGEFIGYLTGRPETTLTARAL